MKIKVDNNLFHDAFRRFGRANRFSHDALDELFRYYEETDDASGEETELDVISICCNWIECDDNDLLLNYSDFVEGDDFEDELDRVLAIIDALQDQTTVIPCGGTHLVMVF